MEPVLRGLYAIMLYNEDQLKSRRSRSDEEEFILKTTSETLDAYERFMALPNRKSMDQHEPQKPSHLTIPVGASIIDRIRSGDIPINEEPDPESVVLGVSGVVELTEDDEIIDIVSTASPVSSDNVVPLQRK